MRVDPPGCVEGSTELAMEAVAESHIAINL